MQNQPAASSFDSRRRSRIPNLGPLAPVDAQILNMTPASNLRKPSFRPSLAPPMSTTRQLSRSSMAPSRGLSDVFTNNMFVNSGENSAPASSRRSMIPNSTNNMLAGTTRPSASAAARQPRPSSVPRPSSFGVGTVYSSAPTGPLPTAVPSTRDPRPLRDRTYQNSIIEEIHKYLVDNNFEIEMKHPLPMKSLKTPTQKDFVMLFHWLYHRIDPGFRFAKTIDTDVYFLIRTIRYPYIESINKSQIAAVGGQNWPMFLGLLYWLVQLCKTLEQYDAETENAQSSDEGMLSQILDRYASKTYRAHLEHETDFSEYGREVEQEIAQFSISVQDSIKDATAEVDAVRKRVDELSATAAGYDSLQDKRAALESDLVKFNAYISAMKSRQVKWESVLVRLVDEVAKSTQELAEVEAERATLQNQIAAQGLAPADIDRMNSERDDLERTREALRTRYDELSRVAAERNRASREELAKLEDALQQYSDALYRIGLPTDPSSPYAVTLDSPLSEENLGKRPGQLIRGRDLRSEVRPAFQKIRAEVLQRVHEAQEHAIQIQGQLDRAQEGLDEKLEDIERLEARLNTSRMNYEVLYEKTSSDTAASTAKTELLEREIQNLKAEVEQGLQNLSDRSQEVDLEYSQVQDAVDASRKDMNRQLTAMINFVISFKVKIQYALEDYEKLVERELRQQYEDTTAAQEP